MREAKRSIFRTEAVLRYTQENEQAVLPRFIAPHTFLCIWLLLALLIAGGLIVSLAQVPIYAAGLAIVVDGQDQTKAAGDDLLVAAFVPPDNLTRLRTGQTVWLHLEPASERVSRPIIAVEPTIISPEAARRRFGVSTDAVLAITQPSAVVLARLEPLPTGLLPSSYVGGIYRVEIEVGSQRVLSLLPLLGQFGAQDE